MSQILVRRGRSALSALCLSAICGVAIAPTACTIIKDERNDESAGSPASAGTAGSAGNAGHGEEAGESAGGAAGSSDGTAGAGGEEAGAGGEGGAPIVMIDPPATIVDGDVRVSCTVACEGASGCAEGAVFVSACAKDNPGTCYEITPIDDPAGTGDVLERTTCAATTDTKEQPPVDLLFAIDTTSSMGSAVKGVVASIDSFVSGLATKGVKMRIGGIAFGNVAPLTNCTGNDAPFVPFTP